MPKEINQQLRERIESDPDFILIKRYNFSLQEMLKHTTKGASEKVISKALGMTPTEIESAYEQIVAKLKAVVNK